MMKYLAFALLLLASCTVAPVPTVPPSPTAVVMTVTVSTVTPIPTLTITTQPTPSVTGTPTPEPAIRSFHPVAREVGTINVLEAVCKSKATTWLVYEYGMTRYEDTDAELMCINTGKLPI